MTYNYSYDPLALLEYHEAIVWYAEKSLVAADNFIAAIDEKVKKICNTPTLYRNVYKNSREVSLDRFPYSVVYFIDETRKTIVISSVYHHKRNPRRKYKK